MRAKFLDAKVKKPGRGDPGVYKVHQPVFRNYTANHYRVTLADGHVQAKHLRGLVIEIQLKTEDMNSTNRLHHDAMHKAIIPLTETEEAEHDALDGVGNLNELLKAIQTRKQYEKLKPFSEAWTVMQVLERHGFQGKHLKYLPPIWLALQIVSADQPIALEALCTIVEHQLASVNKERCVDPLPLFGGSWGLIRALRARCDDAIQRTRQALLASEDHWNRYRAWILSNVLVFLYCWGMEAYIESYLTTCFGPTSTDEKLLHRASALLVFLSPTGRPVPSQEERLTLGSLWSDPIEFDEEYRLASAPIFAAWYLVEMGVYPILRPSYESYLFHGDVNFLKIAEEFTLVSWPGALGSPQQNQTLNFWGNFEVDEGYQPEEIYFPRMHSTNPPPNWKPPPDQQNNEHSTHYLQRGDPTINWIRLAYRGMIEDWDCTVPSGVTSLEENQQIILAFCQLAPTHGPPVTIISLKEQP